MGRVIIITRTKNRPVLLARALASVLNQNYTNWHLYLVNDGGATEVVDDLVKQYENAFAGRITVKHHAESLGMEAASNSGLKDAEGDYVVIHDDDDAWHPDFLQRTVDFLKKKENERYAAVAVNCEVVNEQIIGNSVIIHERMPWSFWKERIDFLDQLLGNTLPPICLLIRKSIVDQIGGYNESLPVLGDWDYNLRILTVGDIGTINKELAYYHHRRANVLDANYGNSVTSGINKHLDYQVLYRNSLIRPLLQKDPAFAGVMHIILTRLDVQDKQIREKLNAMHWDINNRTINGDQELTNDIRLMAISFNKMIRPIRWVWRKAMPVRKIIARMRGRI